MSAVNPRESGLHLEEEETGKDTVSTGTKIECWEDADEYQHPLGRHRKGGEREISERVEDSSNMGENEDNLDSVSCGDENESSSMEDIDPKKEPERAAAPRKSIRWGHVEVRKEEIIAYVDKSSAGTSTENASLSNGVPTEGAVRTRWRNERRRMSSFEDERAMLRKVTPPSKIQMLKKIRKVRRAALKAEVIERQNMSKARRWQVYQRVLLLGVVGLGVAFLTHHSCDTWIESLTITVIAFVIAIGCLA